MQTTLQLDEAVGAPEAEAEAEAELALQLLVAMVEQVPVAATTQQQQHLTKIRKARR